MKPKINKCSECGGGAEVIGYLDGFVIDCMNADCENGTADYFETQEEAIDEWNRNNQ